MLDTSLFKGLRHSADPLFGFALSNATGVNISTHYYELAAFGVSAEREQLSHVTASWVSLDPLRRLLGLLGVFLGAFSGPLGASRAPLEGTFGASRGHSGISAGVIFAKVKVASVTSPLRCDLEPSWGHLGAILRPSWPVLGPSWGHLGTILGRS